MSQLNAVPSRAEREHLSFRLSRVAAEAWGWLLRWSRSPGFPAQSTTLLAWGPVWLVVLVPAEPSPLAVLFSVLAPLPLRWRRQRPALAGHLAVLAGLAVFLAFPYAVPPLAVGVLLGCYTLARHRVHHPLVLLLGGSAAALLVNWAQVPLHEWGPYEFGTPLGTQFLPSLPIAVGVLCAIVAGEAERGRVDLRWRRRRDERRRVAAEEEREAIARELHDIVSHSVSLIAVRAESATYTTPDLSSEAREGFQQIAHSSRETLNELRQLLGVLRSDRADAASGEAVPVPQPTLDRLGDLLNDHRQAGGSAELLVDGTRRRLPSSVELAAYRIVQESLTNARRHAPESHARVSIRYRADGLAVQVLDDGPGPAVAEDESHGGHGVIGMRERVALLGGDFYAGPGPDGGFFVSAVLTSRTAGEASA
ncbi:histidine kinase [Streptomyces hainanensis]|uniref:histidine kinase n=1 Tax=Streptomyces hainanensis TaxID=402648 RepID=A0A4R4T3H7_9ACTN|nr:histidine kinase [Streptomyces hainanensis]TDC69502.1 two-component sensor histidine kinase [Streptomyces hainanensis]